MDKGHIGAQKGSKLGKETKLFLKERTAAGKTISGIRSGVSNVDIHTLGFQPGQLITISSYGFYNTKEVVFIDSLNALEFEESPLIKKDRLLRILRKLKGLAMELQIPIIVNYFAEGSEEDNNLVKETNFMQLYSNIHFALYREEQRTDDIIDVYNLEILNRDLMQHKVCEFMFNKEYDQFEEVIN